MKRVLTLSVLSLLLAMNASAQNVVCGASPDHSNNSVTCLGAGGAPTGTYSCYAWSDSYYAEVSIDACGDLHWWADQCCAGTIAAFSVGSNGGTFVGPSSSVHNGGSDSENLEAYVKLEKPITPVVSSSLLKK